MKFTRRTFLEMCGLAPLAGLATAKAQDEVATVPEKIRYAKETTTICPYCGVGCGEIVHTEEGKIINIEGDPDHPINEGALCSKGASIYQINQNERRLTKVRHRKPGSGEWEDMSWDDAMRRIAELMKKTRDETWIGEEDGHVVNRAHGIACLGGAALDTEECYLLVKAMRGMGLTWIEHQARI